MYKKSTLWTLIALLALTLMGSTPAIFACGDDGGEGVQGLTTGDDGLVDPRDNKVGCNVDPIGRIDIGQPVGGGSL